MNKLHDILSFVCESVVTFLVPAAVWMMLLAGCYQLVRDKIRELRALPRGSQSLAHESTG